MSFTADTGEHKATRSDLFFVDPRALVVDYGKNIARGGEPIEVDEKLIALARDMMPRKGPGDSATGSTGQVHPITVRPLPDRRLEVVMGFRRMRAAMWLIESGECPDFKVKYVVVRMNDTEAALSNMIENMHREDPAPIQQAHAIRALTEDYGMELSAVAQRLKISLSWCNKLLELVALPSQIQSGVAQGDVTVGAALEIAKIPGSQTQVKAFNEIKESKGKRKVKAEDVKKIRRNIPAANGQKPKNIPRRWIDVLKLLEVRSDPEMPGNDIALALIDYANGLITEDVVMDRWDRSYQLDDEGDNA